MFKWDYSRIACNTNRNTLKEAAGLSGRAAVMLDRVGCIYSVPLASLTKLITFCTKSTEHFRKEILIFISFSFLFFHFFSLLPVNFIKSKFTSICHHLPIVHSQPGIWPKLTRITNLYNDLSTGTIGLKSIRPKSSRRQIGYIFLQLYFGDCSVFRLCLRFCLILQEGNYERHISPKHVIKSLIGVWVTAMLYFTPGWKRHNFR